MSSGWPVTRRIGAVDGVQQDLHGHRGRSGDPLYAARRTLHTGDDLLTDSRKTGSRPCSRSTNTSRSKPPGAPTNAQSIAVYREPSPSAAANCSRRSSTRSAGVSLPR